MNIFVIHSSKDKNRVKEHLHVLSRKTYKLNPLLLENGGIFWRWDAEKKIKKAQSVIFFAGKDSYQSPYIGWEIKCAMKHKKPIYTILLDADNPIHPDLMVQDSFSKSEARYDETATIDTIADILNAHQNQQYAIFNQPMEAVDINVLLEQYKAFLQTSEDLVTRRQNVNNFYISLSSALFALLSALFAFEMKDSYRLLIGIVFCIIGVILSGFWKKIIISYGNLNGSKMTIIQGIEKQLPVSLFAAEWAALSDKLNQKKYVSFTDSEKKIPVIFTWIYALMGIIMAAVLCAIHINWLL